MSEVNGSIGGSFECTPRSVGLPAGFTISMRGIEGGCSSGTGCDSRSNAAYDPIYALISLLAIILGGLLARDGIKRCNAWMVLAGWIGGAGGIAGVLYAILWWSVVS